MLVFQVPKFHTAGVCSKQFPASHFVHPKHLSDSVGDLLTRKSIEGLLMRLKFSKVFKIILTVALIPLKNYASASVVTDSQVLAPSVES